MTEQSKRVGRFSIYFSVIEKNHSVALQMLEGKVIIRAEARLEMAVVEYHAYCDDFDEVEFGQRVPEYVAEFIHQEIPEDDTDGSPGGKIKVIDVFQRWVKV